MKLLSSIRLDSLITPIILIFSTTTGKTLVYVSSKYEGSTCVSTSIDCRMRNFRAGNAAGSARGVVEKK